MGNALSNCLCKRHRIGCAREITLLMVGLDNAGKTCTIKHLLGQPTADSVPTVGFSSISLKQGKSNITIYDIGGGPKIRGIWEKYFALVHGLIFVVDACDHRRLAECRTEIRKVLENEKIAGKPMLVLMNKSENQNAFSEHNLVEELELEWLVNKQKCPTRVETSCALFDKKKVRDPGIIEGFGWLISTINHNFEHLHQRVEEDVNKQKVLEEKEQAERVERVRKLREERERLAALQETGFDNKTLKDEEDDDDDVIVGNPFKSCDLIRAELEQNDQESRALSTPTVRVIHVSPTNSTEASNRDEVILVPQPLVETRSTSHIQAAYLNDLSSSNACNGSAMPPFCIEEEAKKKSKKSKKRFKNRVVPDIGDSSISLISKVNELPPLRAGIDIVGNGQPVAYMSPKTSSHKNGQVNWAAAEELEPCKETSNTGCRRVEAWTDSVH